MYQDIVYLIKNNSYYLCIITPNLIKRLELFFQCRKVVAVDFRGIYLQDSLDRVSQYCS